MCSRVILVCQTLQILATNSNGAFCFAGAQCKSKQPLQRSHVCSISGGTSQPCGCPPCQGLLLLANSTAQHLFLSALGTFSPVSAVHTLPARHPAAAVLLMTLQDPVGVPAAVQQTSGASWPPDRHCWWIHQHPAIKQASSNDHLSHVPSALLLLTWLWGAESTARESSYITKVHMLL